MQVSHVLAGAEPDEFRRLYHGWSVRRHAIVQDITLDVQPGETLGLIGANGSGKSTLLKMLAGIRAPGAGRVTLDGVIARPKDKPRAGQRIEVRPAPPQTTDALPQDLPLEVLYEDAQVIVVNKAPGMVVHPGAGHPDGTLVNALLHHFGALPGDDPERPGIVHRLDARTSGVMVVARSDVAKARQPWPPHRLRAACARERTQKGSTAPSPGPGAAAKAAPSSSGPPHKRQSPWASATA